MDRSLMMILFFSLLVAACLARDHALDRFKNVEDEIAWRTISKSETPNFYDMWEMESINDNPFLPKRNATCSKKKTRLANCCLGSYSKGGKLKRDYSTCSATVANYFSVPEFTEDFAEKRTFRTMKDVLKILNGQYVFSTLGDSVGNQMASAFECSWSTQEDVKSFAQINRLRNPKRWGDGLNQRMFFNVSVDGVYNIMYQDNSYRPAREYNHFESLMNISDIIMMNYGVHWTYRDSSLYTRVVHDLLIRVLPFVSKPGKMMIWRETSAQHHRGVGGEYRGYSAQNLLGMSDEDYGALKSKCLPELVFDHKIHRAWRDEIVRDVATSLGFTVIQLGDPDVEEKIKSGNPLLYMLPFFEHTARRPDLHPSQSPESPCDGTHYCYYPHFWTPVIENLARILETALSYQ